jgi:putative FmdB family regulatory protein
VVYFFDSASGKRRVSVPLYEYKCVKCGRKTEKIENVDGPHLKKCPHCGGKVEALFSAPAIQFKGSGWYVTDYGGKSSGDSGKDEKPATESKDAAKDSGSKDSVTKESATKDSGTKDSGSKEKKSEKSGKKK